MSDLRMPNMDDPLDLDAAKKADKRYDQATDAEIIYDEAAFYRRYYYLAHTCARHLHALLPAHADLRAQLATVTAERDEARAALERCDGNAKRWLKDLGERHDAAIAQGKVAAKENVQLMHERDAYREVVEAATTFVEAMRTIAKEGDWSEPMYVAIGGRLIAAVDALPKEQ